MALEWLQAEVFHHTAGYSREVTEEIWVESQRRNALLQIPPRAGSTGEQNVMAPLDHLISNLHSFCCNDERNQIPNPLKKFAITNFPDDYGVRSRIGILGSVSCRKNMPALPELPALPRCIALYCRLAKVKMCDGICGTAECRRCGDMGDMIHEYF